jgi:formate-dependent nitrite reductase membrane component NrfD
MTLWSTLLKPGHTDEHAIDPARSLRPLSTVQRRPAAALAAGRARVVYDVPKDTAPWGWHVSAYLATKSVGAGAPLVAAAGLALYGSGGSGHGLFGVGAAVIGGFFLACTLLLLVADLKRPERALYLLTKANPTSWLVWGSYILALAGLLDAAWFFCALFGQETALRFLLAPTALAGAGAACYTAFLFGQAQGRDFWQGPLLLPILFVQATLAGAAALGMLALALESGSEPTQFLTQLLLLALLLHATLVLFEVYGPHTNQHIALAARSMSRGTRRGLFLSVCGGAGTLLPVALLLVGLALPQARSVCLALAGLSALIGLLAYEACFVRAGQVVPLS